MKLKLHHWILIGIVLGLGVGYVLFRLHSPEVDTPQPEWHATAVWTMNLLGQKLFIGALKMIFIPLILFSIVAGVTSLPDVRELGSIGIKTLVYYLITTTVAVSIGIVAALAIAPGARADARQPRETEERKQAEDRAAYAAETGESAVDSADKPRPEYRAWLIARRSAASGETGDVATLKKAKEKTPGTIFRDDLMMKFLMNPFESFVEKNALGVIFFAILIGIACAFLGEPARPVVVFFQGFNEVIMLITHWIMRISPLCIGAIVAELVATTGPSAFKSLAWYCATVVGGIAAHVCFLLLLAYGVGGVNPFRFFKGIGQAFLVAFTTRSSAATLPVTIDNVTNNLKVSPKVANFALPVGATINMDGTSLYQAVAIIFLIQLYGGLDDVSVTLNAMTLLIILVTAVLASVGAAAIPSAGLITMAIVASAVGLPYYYIALVFAVDPVLDMFRTATNITGDAVGCVVVNRLERGRLEEPAG